MQADSRRRVCIIDSNEELFPARDCALGLPAAVLGEQNVGQRKKKGATDTAWPGGREEKIEDVPHQAPGHDVYDVSKSSSKCCASLALLASADAGQWHNPLVE